MFPDNDHRRRTMNTDPDKLDAAAPPGPSDGPQHPSPEDGQTQDLEPGKQPSAATPMNSFTKIDVASESKSLTTELSRSILSSENLDQTRDGFAVVGQIDGKTSDMTNHDQTLVRSVVGPNNVDATSSGAGGGT